MRGPTPRHGAIAGLGLLSALVLGCASGRTLMPTPNLYRGADSYPAAQVPEAHRSHEIDLLYVTDRAPDGDGYGAERSSSTAFGSVQLELGSPASWDELVRASQGPRRSERVGVRIRTPTELGRFPPTPRPFKVVDGQPVEDPEVDAAKRRVEAQFGHELRRRLAAADPAEVVLYVHGFNNSFDAAATSHAEVWHFLGRRGVPVLYSWPAARGGLTGYFVDRESGEFTVYHLKETLRLIASLPEVERLHILAHSRGTDVTTTALRELVIESRAAGRNPRRDFRIANLVLAAPDLDLDVVRQRLMAEKFGPAIGRITIYTTQADKALNASQRLMSGTRFGRLQASDLGERERAIFREVTNVNIINVPNQIVGSFLGHSYFRTSPAASSDLILLLRGGAPPGSPERPLRHHELNFWELEPGYP
ncbi:MAG: alpha/beta hydrolase [Proteobacteria bacterium]|nr:alpha/beta hydrolase [Pseudomonadota bacterium]